MAKSGRWCRWIVGITGTAILLQAGGCGLTNTQINQQFVLPAVSSILSDTVFFLLDSALVHLTT